MEALDINVNGIKALPNTEKKPTKEKVKRHLPSLPTATAATEMNAVAYDALSDKSPTDWSFLKNYEIFSLSSDGSFPMMKVSRSKAVRLADREVLMVGGGRCYRISFSNYYKAKVSE